MIQDNLPKDVEGWTERLVHELRLTTGETGPFGPNIMQIIRLTAAMLHTNHTMLSDLVETYTIKVKTSLGLRTKTDDIKRMDPLYERVPCGDL